MHLLNSMIQEMLMMQFMGEMDLTLLVVGYELNILEADVGVIEIVKISVTGIEEEAAGLAEDVVVNTESLFTISPNPEAGRILKTLRETPAFPM